MIRPSENEGHIYELPLPCSVHGLYNERTGTLILETVWCDGRNFDMLELSQDEINKFMDELRHEAMFGDPSW